MTTALLSLSAVLATSVLVAPVSSADAPQNDRPAAVPSGWKAVNGAELAQLTDGTDRPAADRRAPSAAADGSASAKAHEPELIGLQSARNGKFVAAELNYAAPNTGALRARSSFITGGWEGFAFEWDENSDTYALRNLANNRYVAVEKNFTGTSQNVLRTRSTAVGGWEKFVLYYNEGLDRWALQSTLNGLFVTMENSYTGSLQYALRARSAAIGGSWEQFTLFDLNG
ncbi:hypothetical protein [Streptomyces sp. NPDC007346]|uniref:fascin domain-containing protein n=1 Tax=Streptomyces sp. NPDC007346 TaxID=3154682 RepID=UPI00345181B0